MLEISKINFITLKLKIKIRRNKYIIPNNINYCLLETR